VAASADPSELGPQPTLGLASTELGSRALARRSFLLGRAFQDPCPALNGTLSSEGTSKVATSHTTPLTAPRISVDLRGPWRKPIFSISLSSSLGTVERLHPSPRAWRILLTGYSCMLNNRTHRLVRESDSLPVSNLFSLSLPSLCALPPASLKRHVSPGFNTPQEPAAKKGMVEDSEEEDGTDADIWRWVEAEHMEAEHAEEDADEEVRGGLEGQVPDGYDEEEAGREQRRRRGEGAGARWGPLFKSTDENFSMGG
jgi:hypothetical protein